MTTRGFRIGGAVADLDGCSVTAATGETTTLRPQSAAVLRALAARPGEIVGKDALFAEIWPGIAVTDDSLVQCVSEIRKALGPDRERLRTLPKRGYVLEAAEAEESGALRAAPWGASRPPRRATRKARLVAAAALAAVVAFALMTAVLPPRDRREAAALDAGGGERLNLAGEPQGATVPSGPVVAVMPFRNLAEGARWDRLAEAVSVEFISDLGRSSWISVLGDATTRPRAGAAPAELRRALGVDFVVDGSVQAEGGRVRVNAALVRADTGAEVWSRRWEGPEGDLLALQSEAAAALTGELAGSYTGAIARSDRVAARRAPTASLAAYELFLLGVEAKHRMTPEGFEEAERHLLRATAIDPGFARAWSALAIVEILRMAQATDDVAQARAREARTAHGTAHAARAVAADPDDPWALLRLAESAGFDGDYGAAARALERVAALAPNDPDMLAELAWIGAEFSTLAAESRVWAERALALNPDAPDWYRVAAGIAAFATGDDAAAIAALKAGSPIVDRDVYLAAARAGDMAEAERAARALLEATPDFSLRVFLDAYPRPAALEAEIETWASRAFEGVPAAVGSEARAARP